MHRTLYIQLRLPELERECAFLEMSSATKEVATLRRGILNSFDTILKIDMDTPAEANSTGPAKIQKCESQIITASIQRISAPE